MKFIYMTVLAFTLFSCSESIEGLSVEEYIMTNNLVTKELDKGVHIAIDEPGNEIKPNINSRVVVNYRGSLTNGIEFDSGEGKEFELAKLIEGWRIGLKQLGEGGSCKLIIPPGAGYGSNATGSIPANSVLVFDMDLIEVK